MGLQPAYVIWLRSSHSHTGPRHCTAAIEAGQMKGLDRAHTILEILLAPLGASTDEDQRRNALPLARR